MFLLAKSLRSFIKRGTLRMIDAAGKVHVFGEGAPEVTLRLHEPSLALRLMLNPELYAAEAYMDGTLTFEDGAAIHDFLMLFSVNRAGALRVRLAEADAAGVARAAALASGQSDRRRGG